MQASLEIGMELRRGFMKVVGGSSVPAVKRGDIPVIDPSDGQKFTTIARGGSEDVDDGVLAARRAYGNVWRNTPAVERGRFLTRLSARILERHAELAELECRDTGKPIHQARIDITACARYFEV
jgi:aldehyde dehydrogenase (NAD+)